MNVANGSGLSPLCLACEYDHFAVTHILLDDGASVGAGDKEGVTSLHLAAGNGHPEFIRRLLDTAVIPGHRFNTTGDSPVHVANGAGHLEVMRLLLPRLNSRQVNAPNNGVHGTTPLLEAIGGQHAGSVNAVSAPYHSLKHQSNVKLKPTTNAEGSRPFLAKLTSGQISQF